MAEQFSELNKKHINFINKQHIYFVATAESEGYVNVSPKGMDSLRIINNTKVAWLNLSGSGNETAAHLLENNRMTLMFCSFDKKPLIMRLYGSAKTIHERDPEWHDYINLFPEYTSSRQVFILDLEMVQTSCGYAVPHYDFLSERNTLVKIDDKVGKSGIIERQIKYNTKSINNKVTGIFED